MSDPECTGPAAEEEVGSPESLKEMGEHRQLLVEGEGGEEAHRLEGVVEEVGLLFLVMEGVEEEGEQGLQAEEEEGVGVEQGHQGVEEEAEVVGVEEQLNQEVMAVEVGELVLSLLVMVEEVSSSVPVKNELVLLL